MSITFFKRRQFIKTSYLACILLTPGMAHSAINVPPHTHYQAMKLIKAEFPSAIILNVNPLRSTSINGTIGKVLDASTVIEIEVNSVKSEVTMLPDGQHLILGPIVKPGGEAMNTPPTPAIAAPKATQTNTTAAPRQNANTNAGRLFDNYRMKNSDLDSVGGEPDLTLEEYLNALEQLPTITTGSGARHLYIFTDPNCPNCRKEYAESVNALDDFTFHWIPIYAVTPEPTPALVSLVQSEDSDSLANLSKVMVNPTNVDISTLETNNAVIKRLQRNQLLFYRLNDKRTPVTIFRSSNGTPTKVNGHSNTLFTLIKNDMNGNVVPHTKQEQIPSNRTPDLASGEPLWHPKSDPLI